MARDKISGFITETAICEEEHSTTPTTKIVTPPGKKKVLCKRGSDVAGGGSGASNGSYGASGRSSQKGGSASGRGNKTLGWFLNDVLFESSGKNAAESPSSSPVETKSDATSKVLSDRLSVSKAAMHDDGKKRGKRSRQRQVKKPAESKSAVPVQVLDETAAGKLTPKIDYSKEDYWYYDPTSNGYYYEQMGSRGWRRHSPAAEQKRIQMEQEMLKFWREAAGFPMPPFEAYNNNNSSSSSSSSNNAAVAAAAAAANQGYFMAPQVKYDAESDGFYFEMPSVDGWKKRQPNSNSSSSISSNGSAPKCAMNYPLGGFSQIDEGHPISYGAALARGQLPPAYTVAPNISYLPEPFSSDTSSMTTLSEGTPTPPPRSYYGVNGLTDQDSIDAMLAEQYDNALKLEDAFSSATVGADACESNSLIANQGDSQLVSSNPPSKKQATSYADVAAASYSTKDKKEDSQTENREFHRPSNLQLYAANIDGLNNDDVTKNEKLSEHDLLLNFNADKFISDLLSCCPNPQRFMRDLAALKTPVAAPSRMFSLDSPLASAETFDLRSAWSAMDSDGKCGLVDNTWSPSGIGNERPTFTSDLWALSGSLDYQPSGKSKLSIWRNDNLLSTTLVDK